MPAATQPATAPPATGLHSDAALHSSSSSSSGSGSGSAVGQGIWLCGGGQLPDQLWAALSGQVPWADPGDQDEPADGGGDADGGGPGAGQLPVASGFRQGGVLDSLPPGPELSLLLPGTVADLGDAELCGALRGWRRLGSWAAAMECAAAAELADRRVAEAKACGALETEAGRYAAAEIAAALTLTRCSAENLTGRAMSLAELPATWAALACGRIDVPKAMVIVYGVTGLAPDLARRVEAQVLGKAPRQTTGELRKAVAVAAIVADPAAADQRLAATQKQARVERWAEPGGTAALAGRDLPPADVLAADNRINALAAALKADGAEATMDQLRAQVYLAQLLGRPAAAPAYAEHAEPGNDAHGYTADDGSAAAPAHAEHAGSGSAGGGRPTPARRAALPPQGASAGLRQLPAGPHFPAGPQLLAGPQLPAGPQFPPESQLRAGPQLPAPPLVAPLAGSVNLTVPLQTLLGMSSQPADVAGFGPLTPAVTEEILAAARVGGPAVRWCVTVTDQHDRPAGHGCAARQPAPRQPGDWALTVQVRAFAGDNCDHYRESPSYKPPPLLRHLIQARHKTCTFPGCGRPARQCDLDHTIPYGAGGRTCECNLAPLCDYHHGVKHSLGWRLTQPRPGVLQWITPSGWKYIINSDAHPT